MPPAPRRSNQRVIVASRQFPGGIPEHPALDFQEARPAVFPTKEMEQAIESGQCCIDGRWFIMLSQKMFLPGRDKFPVNISSSRPGKESGCIPLIFFNRTGSTLFAFQIGSKCPNRFSVQNVVTNMKTSKRKIISLFYRNHICLSPIHFIKAGSFAFFPE